MWIGFWLVQRAADGEQAYLEDVGVGHGGFDVLVAGEFLHGADVVASFEQVGGEGVLVVDLIEQLDGLGVQLRGIWEGGILCHDVRVARYGGCFASLAGENLSAHSLAEELQAESLRFSNRGEVLDGIVIQSPGDEKADSAQ